MRLWTVQPISVLHQIQTHGLALVDPFQVNESGNVDSSYRWLVWQLSFRINESKGWYPWFAYCERPDLRWVRHSRPSGEHVMIEFEPPEDEVVSFPSWAWSKIFSQQYLSISRADELAWKAKFKQSTGEAIEDVYFCEIVSRFDRSLQMQIEASWLRLFQPDLPARSWEYGAKSKTREAVVEQLNSAWIKKVTIFQSKLPIAWKQLLPTDSLF